MKRSHQLLLVFVTLHMIYFISCTTPQECMDSSDNTQVDCIIQTLQSQITYSGLISSNDGKAYIKDSALTSMLLFQNGNTDLAKRLCDTLASLVESNGILRTAYAPQSTIVLDTNIATTSDLAFSALSLARAYGVTSNTRYLTASKNIMNYIQQYLYNGANCYTSGDNYDQRIMDQNAVIYAAARYLYAVTSDTTYQQFMDNAKNCLNGNILLYQDTDFLQRAAMRTIFWKSLIFGDQNLQSDVIKYSTSLGLLMSKNPTIDIELTSSAAMALSVYKQPNTVFVKQASSITMAGTSAQNSAWTALMLSYTNGFEQANPFADKQTVDSNTISRQAQPDASSNTSQTYASAGLIIGLVTSITLCMVFFSLLAFIFIMRKVQQRQEKKIDVVKIKPYVQMMDMRAVGSPLTPVDDNTVFSPPTPSDAFSPIGSSFTSSPHDPYHIVSPSQDRIWQETTV